MSAEITIEDLHHPDFLNGKINILTEQNRYLQESVDSLTRKLQEADSVASARLKDLVTLAKMCPQKLAQQSPAEAIGARLKLFAQQETGRNREAARLRKERDALIAELAKVRAEVGRLKARIEQERMWARDTRSNQAATIVARGQWAHAWKRCARGFRTKARIFHGAQLAALADRDNLKRELVDARVVIGDLETERNSLRAVVRELENANPMAAADIDDMCSRLDRHPVANLQRCRIARALGLLGPRWDSEERIRAEISRLRALVKSYEEADTGPVGMVEAEDKPEFVCATCNDTHWMQVGEHTWPCTSCPTPCQKCRNDGRGPFCASTPCPCECHKKPKAGDADARAKPGMDSPKQTLPAFDSGGSEKPVPEPLIQAAGSERFEPTDRVVNINLNDDVEVELTERGKQVLAVNELAVRKQYTGPRLRLPFWEFINIFGAERCWYNGAAPVCSMHVKIHRNGVYRHQPVAPPDGEEYRPKWPSEALLAVCGQWETWSPNPESPYDDFTHMRPHGGKTWKAVECEAAARLGRLDAAAGRKKATAEQLSALLKNWSSDIDHAVAAYNEAYAAAVPAPEKLAHGTGTRCPTRRDALPHVFDLVSRRCVFCGMLFEGNAHEMPIMGNLRFSKTLPMGKVVGTDRDLWSCEHFGCAALISKAGFCRDHDFRPGPPTRALRAVHKWWQQVETGDVIQARYEDPCFRWRGSNEWFAPDERLWRNCGLRPLDRLWSSVETEAAAYLGKMDAASAVPRMTPEQLAQALGVSDPVSSALNGEYHNAYTDAIPWKSQLCSHETPGVSFESKAAPYGGTLYRPIRGGLPIPWELIGGGAK